MIRITVALVIAASVSSALAAVPGNPLIPFNPANLKTADARIELKGEALLVTTGHTQQWPGVTILVPEGRLDLSSFDAVLMDVQNTGTDPVSVSLRIDNPGADGTKNCVSGSTAIKPGQTATLRIKFPRPMPAELKDKLFGMRGYPEGWNPKSTASFDPANVTQLLVFVAKPATDHTFSISNIRGSGAYVPLSPEQVRNFFPFIDTFGQYMHRDWPGKVHSLAELQQRKVDEEKELAANPGPADWDQYGGWKSGPTLKATGVFRTEKYQGKWWLVDPEGKLFFSHGIDCVRMLDATPIDQRAAWFADFPGKQPDLRQFLTGPRYALHGHYAGTNPNCFSFAGANLRRKYGENWSAAWADLAHRRLRSWGLNTIGNWSDASIVRMKKTPYVATLGTGGKMIEGSQGYWGKFPDPFDPSFAINAKERFARTAASSAKDPFCIGYFVDNEMAWGDETSLAVGALMSPPEQAAKQAFVSDLKARYGAIDKLNAAWGTRHATWDALMASRDKPDVKKARPDLEAFYTRTAEQYFKTVREAVKAISSDQLYLGCRFAWVNPLAVKAAARYCDVVSYNIYKRSAADFKLPIDADVPLIIGEFHFGALDRGMFHTGLVPMASQEERAATYKDYVQGLLRHPQFVGCHWFQFQDEPPTGRVLDEENYQIGFVDIADTPYRETIDAAREVGNSMYAYRLGK